MTISWQYAMCYIYHFFFFYCNPTSIIIIDDNDILLSCVSCITTQIAMWLLCEMLEIVSRLCRNIEKLFVRWSCMIVNENTSHIFIMVSMITLHNSYQKHFIVWYFELIYIYTLIHLPYLKAPNELNIIGKCSDRRSRTS